MKGYLIFLSGNSSYGQWAKNMVNSLAHFSPDVPISIVGDINLLPERERKYIDKVISINNAHLNDVTGRIAPGKFKLHLDLYSPYDETMYLDIDGVAVQELQTLWEACAGFDIATQVVSKSPLTADKWPCLWLPLPDVKAEYTLPSEGEIPEINSSFIYWRKTDKAAQFWAHAKDNYREHLATKHWGHSFPDELAFNVALAQTQINADLGMLPVQFKAKRPDIGELRKSHYFVGCYGQFSTEARYTYDMYDRIVAYVEKQLYGSSTASKSHHLMKAKFSVSKPTKKPAADVRKIHYDAIVPALTPEMKLLPYGKAAPKPFTNAFNGSIVQGKYVVRLDKPRFFQDRKLAVMDWADGNLSTPQLLKFKTENGHAEDPRCFEFNGRPALVFNDGDKMYFGYIDTAECWQMKPPASRPQDHDGREKNWSPFVYDGRLHVLYAPGHVVEYDLGQPIAEYQTEIPTLTRGHIRGGTQLVEHGGKLYTIFHVRQRVNAINLYWAGLMELEAKPPFKALRWSRTPLWKATFVEGKEIHPAPHSGNRPIITFVTFPSHLEIDADGNCLILAGHHDYTDAVIRLPLKELLKHIV